MVLQAVKLTIAIAKGLYARWLMDEIAARTAMHRDTSVMASARLMREVEPMSRGNVNTPS
jgi:hypothetical protein